MSDRKETCFEFGPFKVIASERGLLRAGQPVPLTPKEFETLHTLLRAAGRLVTKEQLIKEVWPDTFVGDGSVSRNISVLRKALGDGYIQTIPKAGYRFVGTVRCSTEESALFQDGSAAADSLIERDQLSAGNECPASAAAGEPARAPTAYPIPEAALPSTHRRVYVIGTSLFLVPLTLVLLLSAHFSGSTNGHQSATPAHTRLLVLPMENLTGEPDLEYLTDGLTEEIIARLGTLNPISLGVMGPATARHLKGSSKSPTQVGNELNAEYVLASNLAGQRNRIRVSVQLTRVSDGVQLWGADYEREDQSPFGIPSEIALAIANDLRIHPEVSAWNEGTKDGQAHEDYLKGVFFWNKRLKEDVLTAIDYFSRAISRDPNYARPYAGLADSYIVLAGHHLPANAAYAKAREYAEKAVLLDENLAEAHTALAYVMYGENWDWSGAEREYRRAIALDPDYAVAHHWYFMYLTAMRRFPEAIMESETALALDPLSQSINNNAGVTYLMARQYDRAIRQLQKGIELDPNNPVAHGYLGEVYVQQGKYTLAIREFQRAQALESERHNYEFALAGADAASGRMVEANRWAEKLTNYSTTHYTDPMWFVVMYSGFKDRDKTLLSVGAALRAHSCTALDMNADPRLDFVRSDPRFQQTIAAMHLPR